MMKTTSFERATRAVKCLPFKMKFYKTVSATAMSGKELCESEDWKEFVYAPFGKERAEAHFRWMIKCGILRREVDGQGLTDRVRLTPLGLDVMNQWAHDIPRASLREKIYENFRRHSQLNQ